MEPGAIVLGRLTPGLRMATVIGCGIFGVPFWRFLPSLALGSFVYILLYTLWGYFVGSAVLQLLEGIHLPLGVFGSLVPLVILLVWIVRARQACRPAALVHAASVATEGGSHSGRDHRLGRFTLVHRVRPSSVYTTAHA
jgi:hypothetical protein